MQKFLAGIMNTEQTVRKKSGLPEFIFFGNYFYGICAVALSVEATLQQHYPLNGLLYFVLIFLITVLYYAYPYIRKSPFCNDPRTNWYTQHYNFMQRNQAIITLILLVSLILFIWHYWKALLIMPSLEWVLIFIFPVVAAFYYGLNFLPGKYSLRKIGSLKPFVIGFTWAGLVTVYPVLFYSILNKLYFKPDQVGLLLFLKNFMFISVLCIMFDVKDYAADHIKRLKTFVVQVGLRKTIFCILFPLSVIGLGSFVYYAIDHQFHQGKLLLNVIPFILLMIVAWTLRRRRSLLYYLIIVDGLMFVKAVCGSIAMLCF